MKEIQLELIKYLKSLEIKGCITGSALLPEYFENSDVDLFLYDKASFIKTYYTLRLNNMFTILDALELWKAQMIENKDFFDNKHKGGVTTIKFTYNTCMEVNIIFKSNCNNIFSTLASFDLDIICKGYDIQTKQYLDLSENKETKIATWNKWNTAFYSEEVWQISRILRQLERCFKYHRRGYDTDNIVIKYISLIDKLQNFVNIFSSNNFDEKLKITKENTKIVKQICEVWLTTHEISDKQIEKIKELIKLM